jgi:hypothetical protein
MDDHVETAECAERMSYIKDTLLDHKEQIGELQKGRWIGIGIQAGITLLATFGGVMFAFWEILSNLPKP